MGVSGAGKTTVGKLLAAQLPCAFADADDYHSPANVQKMSAGIPLTDADRAPWLEALRRLIACWIAGGETAVLACSALKEKYREHLNLGGEVCFVYLKVSPAALRDRLRRRRGHFMTEAMLDSQIADLEEPAHAIIVDGDPLPAVIVTEILARVRAGSI
jgi:gluconokinase